MLQEPLTDAIFEQRLERNKLKPAAAIQTGQSAPSPNKVLPCRPPSCPSLQEQSGEDSFISADDVQQNPNHPLAPEFVADHNNQSRQAPPFGAPSTGYKVDACFDSAGLRTAAITESGVDEKPTPPSEV